MEEVKKSPYCGEEILVTAKKCKHCGEWLDKTANNSSTKSESNRISNSAKMENIYRVARRAVEDGSSSQLLNSYPKIRNVINIISKNSKVYKILKFIS